MKWFRNEKGQVLVMTAFCMACLLGALGLAVDVGVLFKVRRQMQTAADSAAMAGATAAFYGATSIQIQNAAYSAAALNGVDHSVSGNAVIVTPSPSNAGPVTLNPGGITCASCVEVQLSTPNPSIFMQTMSQWFFKASQWNAINVSAMAVAASVGTNQTCMYVMGPGSDTLWIHGAGDVDAPNCGVYVNSSDPGALCVTGNAGKSSLGSINVVGGQDSKGNCKGDPGDFPVNTSTAVQSLPAEWNSIPSDPTTQCKTVTDLASSGDQLTGSIAGPGYGKYACYTDSTVGKKGAITPVNLKNATLGPGYYIFETGVTASGNTTVGTGTGTTTAANGGATIIITGTGTLDTSTATNFSIYAPADRTSPYNSIAVYQVPSDTSEMTLQFGSSSSYFIGSVVAPGAAVDLHDQGGAVNAATLVVGTIYVNGTIKLADYSSYNPTTTPFKIITLVE
ncbi:MAG TPA: pilus assembly protein TadG-related protein [Terracidiphilus sp.]|jgi:hypothetical protein